MSARGSLAEAVAGHYWFHSIDLGDGVVTPGVKSLELQAKESAAFFDPIDVAGRSVIDIGAWNGAFSFEAKRRGARRVVATDHFTWNDPRFRGREAFDLARSSLGLEVEDVDIDVPALSPERMGTFDVVLFLGVFYHLLDPIDGVTRAASLAREVMVVETHCDALHEPRPAMVFYPGRELADDPTNWWGPNPACVLALLGTLGFATIDAAWSPFGRPRAVFHAWRSHALRRSTSPPHELPRVRRDPIPEPPPRRWTTRLWWRDRSRRGDRTA